MTGGLFNHSAGLKKRFLIKRTANELKSHGQPVAAEASWHGDARQTGHVHCDSENIVEIHFYRISCHFLVTDGECGGRRGRSKNAINTCIKALLEVAFDQGADLLSPCVVGVVETG